MTQNFDFNKALEPGRDYALLNFSPNKISALNFASQLALCIFPATLSLQE